MWLTPPLMNSEITAVARGLKCGAFGANGLTPVAGARTRIGAARASSLSWLKQVRQREPADAAAGA